MSALPIVRDGDYTVSAAGFMIKGHRREHPARLKALLFPSFQFLMAEVEAHRSGNPDQIARAERERQERERSITREWAASQLMHNGIPVVEGQNEIQALSDAVKAGLCNTVPDEVKEIRDRLREEFKRQIRGQLERSPSHYANTDVAEFLHRFFLHDWGEIDLQKAPPALSLHDLDDRFAIRDEAVAAGLHTRSGGTLDRGRVLVVGTDKNLVNSLARAFGGSDLRMRLEDQKDDILYEHEVFLTSGKAQAKGEPHYDPTGMYKVFFPAMEGEVPYKCLEEGLSLSIQRDTERQYSDDQRGPAFVGDFSFAELNGMMRFCRDEDSWSDFLCEDDGLDSDPDCDTRKRRFPHMSRPERHPAQDPDPTIFHFLWRGRETGNNTIEVDYANLHTGWIQFLDKDFTKFRGIFNGTDSIVGRDAEFKGFKVSEETTVTGKRWGNYTQERYDYEDRARWRRR